MKSKIIRASSKTPCPVCQGKKWPCSYTSDRGVAFCGNVYSERRSSDGKTFLHFSDDEEKAAPRVVIKSAPQKRVERASDDHVHAVYTALLSSLSLSDKHRQELHTRGVPYAQIEARGYKSVFCDEERREVLRLVSPLGLSGVPGFFRSSGEWQIVKCLPGFFIPVRDPHGRIRGLMYRLDTPIEKQKYRWLSSADYPQGTSSGAPLHFARPELVPKAREVWLTEGGLKADIASLYLKTPFIASAGVDQWKKQFAEHFKKAFPHIRQIAIAYDRDWRTNVHVRAALERLMEQLKAAGLPFVIKTWKEDYKGIDDLLVGLSREQEVRAA